MKNNFANPSNNRYHQIFEYMFVFSIGSPNTTNLLKDRKNILTGKRLKSPSRKKTGEMVKNKGVAKVEQFGIRYNVWKFNTSFVKDHPAPFPEKLASDHIISWSNPGDLILDTFCGSGTTCKMALENHRNYIGIEISEDYIPLIKQRILNAEPQLF